MNVRASDRNQLENCLRTWTLSTSFFTFQRLDAFTYLTSSFNNCFGWLCKFAFDPNTQFIQIRWFSFALNSMLIVVLAVFFGSSCIAQFQLSLIKSSTRYTDRPNTAAVQIDQFSAATKLDRINKLSELIDFPLREFIVFDWKWCKLIFARTQSRTFDRKMWISNFILLTAITKNILIKISRVNHFWIFNGRSYFNNWKPHKTVWNSFVVPSCHQLRSDHFGSHPSQVRIQPVHSPLLRFIWIIFSTACLLTNYCWLLTFAGEQTHKLRLSASLVSETVNCSCD